MSVDVELGDDVLEELRRAKTDSRLQPQHAGEFDGEF
jgi:hypothetical protein